MDPMGSDMNADRSEAVDDPVTLRAAVEITNRRALRAMRAIGLVGLWNAVLASRAAFGITAATRAHGMLWMSQVEHLFYLAAIVLYCQWLYRAYDDNRRLGGSPLKLSPGDAVVSFFIPVVGLYRPYQALRDLHGSSDPRALSDPAVPRPQEEVAYRSNARVQMVRDWNKWFPVRLWWTLYLFPTCASVVLLGVAVAHTDRMFLGIGNTMVLVEDVSVVFAAGLAVQVVRSIQARQGERLRRLEAAFLLLPTAEAPPQPAGLPSTTFTCPRCGARANVDGGVQRCPTCHGAFALRAGAAATPSVVPPPVDPRLPKIVVKSAGIALQGIGVVAPDCVSTGILDPVIGLIPFERDRIDYASIGTVAVWRKVDILSLVVALLVPLPIAASSLAIDDRSPFFLAVAAVFGALFAWMIHFAVIRRAHFARVTGQGRTLRIRFDKPFWRRQRFHDELLRRAGIAPGPLP
jgi:hypothetical protein